MLTVIVASGIVAVTIFDKQTRAFIPKSYRDTIVYATLLQMFGLYYYSKALKARKKKTGNPDLVCPDCKVDMISIMEVHKMRSLLWMIRRFSVSKTLHYRELLAHPGPDRYGVH